MHMKAGVALRGNSTAYGMKATNRPGVVKAPRSPSSHEHLSALGWRP